MERGAINGQPVWVRIVNLNAGERLVVQEAPGVNGATVESQGQLPGRYRCEFTLVSDGEWIVEDAETASLNLRAMFLAGGPFTVETPVFGELPGLWLPDGYELSAFDHERLNTAEGSCTFLEGVPEFILTESAEATVQAAVSALSEAQAINFGDRTPLPPDGLSENPLEILAEGIQWLEDAQGTINTAFEPVNNYTAQLANLRDNLEALVRAPQNFASALMGTAAAIISLVPSLSRQGDPQLGSAAIADNGNDKPSVVIIEILESGLTFDDDVSTPQGEIVDVPSAEDLAEINESESARSLVLSAVTLSVCLAVIETEFGTLQSILAVADALEPVFDKLFDLEDLDYRVHDHARALRASTRRFLSDSVAGLPRLRTHTTTRATDVFDLMVTLYTTDFPSYDAQQNAIESLVSLNTIPDPLNIPPSTTLSYLDPVI